MSKKGGKKHKSCAKNKKYEYLSKIKNNIKYCWKNNYVKSIWNRTVKSKNKEDGR